ncbi:uncharacterized protein B0P05DRAFT_537451 [Gilbertella persicaria]|uniref:uncharacterized protein n=1 Tax=Gilbertella persicaria TaxID=101096 RepID=UPI00221EBEB7|nr:uncharacterized protein B0P05DRAFT_537451 [Gilbertella persicaria]KAI8082544.1 hypothetical protein B0P05DRAFT_537451 [Gilbertella persicaria]
MMEAHEHVIRNLNEEFKKVDRAFQNDELRIYGKDTERLFKELDIIRRKQIDLASEHVSLESIHDIPSHKANSVKTNQDLISASNKSFDKKEVMLKSMMVKLDDLTLAM